MGSDTVYSITVNTAGTNPWSLSFSYNVTAFDPTTPGADFIPTLVSGTNRPSVNENNPYSCTASVNPSTTGYQWVAAQTTNGDLADSAQHALTNFPIPPPPIYSVTTNAPSGSGKCFHLTHTNPAPQLLEFTEVLFPAANTSLSFQSLLGYATTNEVARVQYSTNGGQAWEDLFAQAGALAARAKRRLPHTVFHSPIAPGKSLLCVSITIIPAARTILRSLQTSAGASNTF